MTNAMLDLVGALLLLFGAVLSLGAAVGLLRFPDVVTRMHAGAKPQTLGLLLIVAGACVSIRESGAFTMGVLIIAFQFLTIPVSTHMVARTAYRTGLVSRDSLVVDELAEQVELTQRAAPRPTPRPKSTTREQATDPTTERVHEWEELRHHAPTVTGAEKDPVAGARLDPVPSTANEDPTPNTTETSPPPAGEARSPRTGTKPAAGVGEAPYPAGAEAPVSESDDSAAGGDAPR